VSKKKPWLKAKKRDHTTGAGKGDMFRPVDKEKFDAGYEAIFGKKDPPYMQRSLDWVNEQYGEALKKLAEDEKNELQ
jgi:hypothetical protein